MTNVQNLGKVARLVGVPIILGAISEIREFMENRLASRSEAYEISQVSKQLFTAEFQKRFNERSHNKLTSAEASIAQDVLGDILGEYTAAQRAAIVRMLVE